MWSIIVEQELNSRSACSLKVLFLVFNVFEIENICVQKDNTEN